MCTFVPIYVPPYCPAIILLSKEYCNPKYYQKYPTLQVTLHICSADLDATIQTST